MSNEAAHSSNSRASHSWITANWDSEEETIDTELSESPTEIDVADGFQSKQRHIEELIFSPSIPLRDRESPPSRINNF
jgi:hypothetical protein